MFHKTSLFDQQKESLDVEMEHPSTRVTGNLCFVHRTFERRLCATFQLSKYSNVVVDHISIKPK